MTFHQMFVLLVFTEALLAESHTGLELASKAIWGVCDPVNLPGKLPVTVPGGLPAAAREYVRWLYYGEAEPHFYTVYRSHVGENSIYLVNR